MATPLDRWVKRHGSAERALSSVLGKFFKSQARRVAKRLGDFDIVTPALVSQIFDADDEHEKLIEVVSDPILGYMASGASDVLSRRPKSTKAASIPNIDDFELSSGMKDAIQDAFTELSEQDYWKAIQDTTGDAINKLITDGVEEGLSIPNMSKRLRESLDVIGRVRSDAIARTETTLAFNSGHETSYATLAADGDISGKEWLSIIDDDTRET